MNAAPLPMLQIRRFTAADLEALLPVEHEAYPDPWTQGMLRQEIDSLQSHFFVMHSGEALVGYGGFWLLLDEAHVTKVTVAAPWRGQGLGAYLMRHLLHTARANGAETMRLEVRESNQPAIALYERLGFARVGVRKGYYAKCNENAVVMVRTLDDLRP
jgi:ribosomal-protein-alanine N-acetyltransferase